MSAAARVLFDEPGPRGRRRILIGSIVSAVVIAAVIVLAVLRFADAGQLAKAKWSVFFDPGIPKFLLTGLVNTLKVAAVGALVAFPAGALLGLLRLAQHRIVRWLATIYIEVFRSTPLLLLVFMFVGALPALGLNLPVFWKLTIPIILCNAAILAEVFRAGVRALPRGQGEAALAVGLTYWQSMRLVILPQAIRIIIPSLVTQLVSLLKDSTLGYAASYPELMRTATNLTSFYNNFIQSYLVVAVIFVVINLALSYLARVIERRMTRGRALVAAEGSGDDVLHETQIMGITAVGGGLR